MRPRGIDSNCYDVGIIGPGFSKNAILHHVLDRFSVVLRWGTLVHKIRPITMEEKEMHQCHQALGAELLNCILIFDC